MNDIKKWRREAITKKNKTGKENKNRKRISKIENKVLKKEPVNEKERGRVE